ncbi:hypothetical protein L211DRAFT_124630 [Terfezia boudieri ATCC MYA-4762]|uniref:Uncharacterized protein n=1 Tax=Terfezia boudieri ATCC MYA-4762 TaxID=1051890 RepID=A0A3N4L628_9PEZI|nr:hypothetical protein L211DRAFT_124630 [Terfezia boudieri ATCC MYA-4762]
MLIHVLENRRQQWAASGLPNAFALTSVMTMNDPEVAMEPFANAGMAGVRANNFPELDIDEWANRVHGKPVGIDGAADAAWDGAVSW